MSSVFGKDFEQRADLQRRQVYHQQLLDSQRFRDATLHPHQEREGAREAGKVRETTEGALGKIAIALALLFFFFTIPAMLLSAIAGLPVSLGLMLVTRKLASCSVDSGRGFYRTACLGIFVFLCVTAAVVLAVTVAYALRMELGWSVAFSRLGDMPILWLAILSPGLLACAAVWSRRIGAPFRGSRGYLTACALSFLLVPASVGTMTWACIKLLNLS